MQLCVEPLVSPALSKTILFYDYYYYYCYIYIWLRLLYILAVYPLGPLGPPGEAARDRDQQRAQCKLYLFLCINQSFRFPINSGPSMSTHLRS